MAANPRNIKWPTDTTGFLYRLKHAGVQAVERQFGNPEKHTALMATLRVLAKHAQERYEAQQSAKQEALKYLTKPDNPETKVETKE